MSNSKPQENVAHLAPDANPGAPSFGSLLKQWRNHRRLSQLNLALESGISQRHISFLETGRAQPSRRAVMDLAETLGVPLRERNTLLSSNAGAVRLFSEFIEPTMLLGLTGTSAPSFPMVRLCMEDEGLKPFIENWSEVAYSFLQRARAALLANPLDSAARQLVDYLEQHPAAPEAWHAPIWNEPSAPALGIRLRKGQQHFSLFSMMAHFGAPQQITTQELSVELFFPADATTRQALTELVKTSPKSTSNPRF